MQKRGKALGCLFLFRPGHLTVPRVTAVGLTAPGLIFRVRRPHVVLAIHPADPLWPQ
jgi:hypothetical protein